MSYALATITNPSAALTDFSLIVDLSRMPANWWTAVDTTDGTRGRVYKGDGTTQLPADWIDFDNVADTGLLRVKWTGTLATTGTQQLWIEPPVTGNATVAANATYGSDNAYDANWEGYWPDGGGTDRTSNGYDGTGVGDVSIGGVSGNLGAATDFDGSNDYIEIDSAGSEGLGEVQAGTVLAWIKADTLATTDKGIVSDRNNGINSGFFQLFADVSQQRPSFLVHDGTNERAAIPSATTLDTGWLHTGGVWSSTNVVVYENGSSSANAGVGLSGAVSNTQNVYIGYYYGSGSRFFDGAIQEVQIHHTERSADWISSEYDQTSDQATFWGTWSWETAGGTTYSVSVSDGVSLSDTPSGALTITANASDGVSLGDSSSGALRISAVVSDGISLGDSSGGTSTIPLTVADSIVLSDAVITAFTFGVQASDGITLSDQAVEGGVISISASDGITFSDSASGVLRILQTVADGVVFGDSASSRATISATVSDGVTFSDAVSAALRIVASVTDGVVLSDVAIDSTFLPVGRVQIKVTTKQASVTIVAKQPGVSVAFE